MERKCYYSMSSGTSSSTKSLEASSASPTATLRFLRPLAHIASKSIPHSFASLATNERSTNSLELQSLTFNANSLR